MSSKYSAKHVYWDTKKQVVRSIHDIEIYRCKGRLKLPKHITRFDSQHEFKVYLELCRMYGEHRVRRQTPVEIIPPGRCYPAGKTWKVDFAIANRFYPLRVNCYVEAKGYFIPAFGDTLAMLETSDAYQLDDLYLIFPEAIPTDKKVIKSLQKSGLSANLLTLNDLRQLTELS